MWRNWNLCTLLAGMQNAVATVEDRMGVPQTIKDGITMWLSNPPSGNASERIQSRISQRCLHTHVHSSIIHNSQDVEATQVSISRWMDKQNAAYIYNGILFSYNKERSSTCYNMDESWKHYADWNVRHRRTNIVWFDLHEISRIGKSIKANISEVNSGWERREWRAIS